MCSQTISRNGNNCVNDTIVEIKREWELNQSMWLCIFVIWLQIWNHKSCQLCIEFFTCSSPELFWNDWIRKLIEAKDFKSNYNSYRIKRPITSCSIHTFNFAMKKEGNFYGFSSIFYYSKSSHCMRWNGNTVLFSCAWEVLFRLLYHAVIFRLNGIFWFSGVNFTQCFAHKLCNNFNIINRIKMIHFIEQVNFKWPISMNKSINWFHSKWFVEFAEKKDDLTGSCRTNNSRWKWKEQKATEKSIFIEFIKLTG